MADVLLAFGLAALTLVVPVAVIVVAARKKQRGASEQGESDV